MRKISAIDMPLLFCFLFLVGLGIACVYTASYPTAMTGDGSSFSIAGKQVMFALFGLVGMFICMLTPLSFFHRHAKVIAAGVILLLLLVFVLGHRVGGNTAWIDLHFFKFQPSELAKFGIIICLAAYLSAHPWSVKSWKGLFTGPFLIIGVPMVLIVLQQDLGTATILALSSVFILAIAGTKFRFWGIPMLALLFAGSVVVMTGHRAQRIDAWLHPFNRSIEASYQPRNSLIAVGSGGVFGRGVCESRQKWFYLPEPYNDYILAIVTEELGFLLTALLIFVPYLFFMFRGFTIANRAPDEFSALVAAGCTVMLGAQALVNMAVVSNVIPCMGITLPFISAGGTSMIASLMMAGLLLNVSGIRLGQRHQAEMPPSAQPSGA